MTTTTRPDSAATGAGAPSAPTPAEVIALQGVRADPAVSLLLTTTPGPRMTSSDAARLDQLVAAASRRLQADLPFDRARPLAAALSRLASQASSVSTRSAIALFASDEVQRGFTLPIPVCDRVVVDPTFATRDLVRALHRTPRYLLLVLTKRSARLFDGVGDELRAVQAGNFPFERVADELGDAAHAGYLREVDRALSAYLRVRPAPLVLAGVGRLLADFTALSANTARLAGTLRGSYAHTPTNRLGRRVRPVLEAYLRSRQEQALEHLTARGEEFHVAGGVQAVWLAARAERPEMLAVEEGLFFPARLSDDGDYLLPADDIEHPDVLDDAVDEIIETVLQRGGWVALIEDGALPVEHERIALTLRRGR